MARNDRSLDAAIAATRFGLGARPGEIAAASSDPQGWLAAQISPAGADGFAGATAEQVGGQMQHFREEVKKLQAEYGREPRRLQAAQPATGPTPPPGARGPVQPSMSSPSMASSAMAGGPVSGSTMMAGAPTTLPLGTAPPPANEFGLMRQALYQPMNQANQASILARAQLAATTSASFRERWALFWSNHFTTAAKNEDTRLLAPVFEREAVRPHVFGRFEQLLIASSLHPGMMAYLDQQQSVGPNSVQVQRAVLRQGPRARQGLNENLAREIMELHTVGADGGYSQADVTEFARALTGFGIGNGNANDGQLGKAIFREPRHEPGQRTVWGKSYADTGETQAAKILVDLAARPQTAHRLCSKITAHFVSDTPDPKLVARLEAAWKRTGGDLSQVALALIQAPEAWTPQPMKLKTPYELLISSYRALDKSPANVQREVEGPLGSFGQRPFTAPQPNGWSDEAIAWAAPDALVKRLTWAQGFAATNAPQADPTAVAQAALGARLTPPTATSIARAESRPEAVALLIMSPEFQRR